MRKDNDQLFLSWNFYILYDKLVLDITLILNTIRWEKWRNRDELNYSRYENENRRCRVGDRQRRERSKVEFWNICARGLRWGEHIKDNTRMYILWIKSPIYFARLQSCFYGQGKTMLIEFGFFLKKAFGFPSLVVGYLIIRIEYLNSI